MYSEIKADLIYAIKKSFQKGKEDEIFNMLDKYIEYVEAVVENVAYEVEFSKGYNNEDNRHSMEFYNSIRTSCHNDAITATIKTVKSLLKDGIVLNQKILELTSYKSSKDDFNRADRRQIGDYIFQAVTAFNTLTEREIENISKYPIQNELQTKINRETKKISKIEKSYDVEITEDQEDLYSQASKSNYDR